MHELKVNVNKKLTSFRIFSARRSTLTSLATWGVKLLCHSVSSILSKCIPSSKITVEILAALKHVELIDSNPEILLYSTTASKVDSHPYNWAISLRFLCHHIITNKNLLNISWRENPYERCPNFTHPNKKKVVCSKLSIQTQEKQCFIVEKDSWIRVSSLFRFGFREIAKIPRNHYVGDR